MATRVRAMGARDVPRINEIYNHYIVDTHISFDTEPWGDEARLSWFERYADDARYPRLVLDEDDEVWGAAWAGPYRAKQAYDQTVETTVVLHPDALGRGWGRLLLESLIAALAETPAHRAVAIVALPNDPSVRLHHSLGYRTVGVLEDCGFKFGEYWSTELLELSLPPTSG